MWAIYMAIRSSQEVLHPMFPSVKASHVLIKPMLRFQLITCWWTGTGNHCCLWAMIMAWHHSYILFLASLLYMFNLTIMMVFSSNRLWSWWSKGNRNKRTKWFVPIPWSRKLLMINNGSKWECLPSFWRKVQGVEPDFRCSMIRGSGHGICPCKIRLKLTTNILNLDITSNESDVCHSVQYLLLLEDLFRLVVIRDLGLEE